MTEMEYIAPMVLKKKGLSFETKCFIFAMVCCIIAAIVHLTIEPKGAYPIVRHPQVGYLSDREQEKQYCAMLTRGTPVHGGTASQIELHCLIHS